MKLVGEFAGCGAAWTVGFLAGRRSPVGARRWVRAGCSIVAATACAGILAACSPDDVPSADAGTAVAKAPSADGSAADAAPATKRFTKAQFDSYAFGRTKAQIREEFGPPLVVHDDTDTWFYPGLPIYDAEAGIQVSASIRFIGAAGPDDTVAEVRY